jgi:hypothetical protein
VFYPRQSWRFVPFHLTDQLQFGRVADLLEFWQTRDDSIMGTVSLDTSAPANYLSLCAPESSFVRCYLRRIGADYELTLASYWQILAERFALMPHPISMLNWKAVALFDMPLQDDPRAAAMADPASLVSFWRAGDWQALREQRQSFDALAAAVGRMGLTVADYFTAQPFDLAASSTTGGEQ